jgi:dihydrofolate reductase
MAKLTLTSFLSLDGVMQAPGGPNEDTSGGFEHGGWVFPLAEQDMGAAMVDIFSRAGAFLLGRRTYDIFAAHWPRVTNPHDLVARKLNTRPKYVASHTRKTFSWEPTAHIDVTEDAILGLKARHEGELQIHGSGKLAQSLLQLALIDEINLLIFPVVLGNGKRLFDNSPAASAFELSKSSITTKGVMIATYARAGSVRTGSFAMPE